MLVQLTFYKYKKYKRHRRHGSLWRIYRDSPVFRRSTMKVPSFFKFPHTSQIAQIPKKP